ncbi:MAG: flagellar export chaperone FlgN [Phycisphaerae bacterium]|nr:flagellar export chaperone FlgN [Phycisphaerae bacterium]
MSSVTGSLKPVPHTPELGRAADALLTCFHVAYELLSKLLALADDKLDAIRRADAKRLNQNTHSELKLLQQIAVNDQERNAVLARIAQALRRPELKQGRASEIAAALPEPTSSRLRARISGLREVALNLRKKNDLVARVARDLQTHIRDIFAEVAKSQMETAVYDACGQHERHAKPRMIVDALG